MAFIKLAELDEIKPGKMQRYQTDGKRILICHVDDGYHAVDDTCSHEDASLYLGALHGDVVKCSLHGGKFNVRTGAPVEEPACSPLHVYPLEVRDDGVYVDTDN